MDNGLSGEEALVLAKGYARQKIEEAGGMTSEGIQEIVKEALGDTPIVLEDLRNQINNKISTFNAESNNETTIESCADGVIKNLKLYGKTEQKQYQGYNVFDNSLLLTQGVSPHYSSGSITIDNEGVVHIDNATTEYTYATMNRNVRFELPPDTYYLYTTSNSKEKFYVQLKAIKTDGTEIRLRDNGANATLDGTEDVTISLQNSGDSLVDYSTTIKFFISNKAGLTIDDYEPYVGGIPSPSPDYPQEIKSVEKIDLKVCGRNLFKYCDFAFKSYPSWIGLDGTKNMYGEYVTNSKAYFDFKANTTYIISNICENISNFQLVKGEDGVNVFATVNGSNKIVFTENVRLWFRVRILDETMSASIKVMLEVGETASEYEPYKGTELSIVPPRPLNAIDEYKDYCDVENGVWRFRHTTVTVNSLKWTWGDKNGGRWEANLSSLKLKAVGTSNMLCSTHVTGKTSVIGNADGEICGNSSSNRQIYIKDSSESIDPTSDNGIILYPLENETTEPIDPTLLSQLRNLPTYRGCINIIATDQDGNDITTWFLYAFDLLSWFNEVNEKLDIATDNLIQIGQIYENESINSAWAYVNSVYSETMTDLYD